MDDSTVKVGGTVLPGLFKSLEIKSDAKIDEETVQGSTSKPKQATGYEDAKLTLELVLEDSPTETKEQKLTKIQNLFRAPTQGIPVVHEIVNVHTSLRGIKKVLFKSLTTKEQNTKVSEITASLEFWEYVPTTITATKAGSTAKTSSSSGSTGTTALSAEYQSYLKADRGKAPKATTKTASSPAKDTVTGAAAKSKLAQMPY
jgi:hypothetical protein|nr:MAG TPA: hypothetical protein [Caudoviricetes sp.]